MWRNIVCSFGAFFKEILMMRTSNAFATATALLALTFVALAPVTADAAPVAPSTKVGTIVFHSDRVGPINDEIYRMNVNGTGQVRITENRTPDVLPALSPNGKKIAFVSFRDGNSEIYTMNVSGSGQTRLTFNDVADSSPAWSPDSTKITFDRVVDGQAEIFTMNADGTGQTNRTNNLGDDRGPAWSPDGTKIAFSSNRSDTVGVDLRIYTMNVNGSALTQLTEEDGHDPAWSPDGTKIAFTSGRDDTGSQIFSMNADGSDQTNLTNYDDNPHPDADGGRAPSWSPDGTKIAFSSNRDSGDDDISDIYTMNADGSAQTRITTNPTDDSTPSWGSRLVANPGSRPGPHLPPKVE